MCEQTPVDYKDGDIVWVKLGPCWWPGEVHDLKKLPPEWLADFKKSPLAAVKFFDENSYEYVRSIDKIYHYNCTKKNEFIKKGLDLHRAKNAFMEKFPADVTTAEKKTNGDPNIIDDPMFNPEKKTNFAALLFGSPKVKKSPRKSTGSGRKSATSSSRNQSTSGSFKLPTSKVVTHPRFLGRDDHEVRILVQSPDKSELEKQEAESIYNCTSCGFTTTRIDVIVLHNKSHIQGVYSTPTSTVKKGKKTPVKRGKKVKMTRSKTSSIVEDLDLIDKGLLLSTESSDEDAEVAEEEPEPKRKRKKNKRKPKKVVVVKKAQETKADIRDNLLAEWEEDSETEEDSNVNVSCTTAESDTSVTKIKEVNQSAKVEEVNQSTKIEEVNQSDKVEEVNQSAKIEEVNQSAKIEEVLNQSDNTNNTTESPKKDVDKSCFDFEEEEDEIIGTSVGRKIPRVIPPTDRQKSTDPGQDDADLPIAEDDVNRNEQIKDIGDVTNRDEDNNDQENITDNNVEKDADKSQALNITETDTVKEETGEKSSAPDIDAFKEILEATVVPDLPEIPHSLKFEQNFHNAKTIKFPDKPSATDAVSESNLSKPETKEVTETSSKLINPKKRFVKSFEDFEQQLNNEQRKLMELEQPLEKVANVVEVSKLKTQLMSKLENAETWFPKDSQRNKQIETTSRQSRSLRERILEKQREEKSNLDVISSNKSHTVESLSPKSKLLEYTRPKSPHEAKPYEVADAQRLEENRVIETENPKDSGTTVKPLRRSSCKDDKTDLIPHCKTVVHPETPFIKSRRLSVKMPEIEETKPYEMEHTGELLELEQHTVVAEPAKVLEEKDTIETLQVEQIVMEEAHTELQPAIKRLNFTQGENESSVSNKSPLNLTKDENVCTEGIAIDSSINELHKNHSQSEDSNTENAKVKDENIKVEYSEENLKTLTGALESEKDNELFDLRKSPVINNLETTQAAAVAVGISKSLFDGEAIKEEIESNSERVELELNKTADAVVANVQHYVHTSFSENNSPNFRIDNKDSEDLSALTTLATVSELTTNLDIHGSSHNEKSKIIEDNLVSDHAIGLNTHSSSEKGNLTFVTEDDLADGQVEIADVPTITKHKTKPITLTSFSVDFTDSNQTGNAVIPPPSDSCARSTVTAASGPKKRKHSQDSDQVEVSEKIVKTPEFEKHLFGQMNTTNLEFTNLPKSDYLTSADVEDSINCDIEDQIPSLVVCSSMQPDVKRIAKPNYLDKIDHPEYTSSSKLLEILTDGKPKSMKNDSPQKSPNIFDVPMQSNRKIDSKFQPIITKDTTVTAKTISKFDPKNSKFVIKSTTPGKPNIVPVTNKSNKPIILSEKIIKPLTESSESVSVQKVTSKRSNQDIEDIDAFIIQKPAKKIMVCQDVDVNETNTTSNQSIKKPLAQRGKAKILQQTIIKPAGDIIQPTSSTAVSQPPVDDNMFDINSMPIVLGDQILTAESIENMPVVLSDTPVQSTTTKTVSTPTTTPNKSQAEQIKLLNKSTSVTTQPVLVKTYSSQKMGKGPRIYQTSSTKVIKNNPAIITRPGKPDKFIIVPPGSSASTGSKYTVGKKPPVTKRSSPVILPTPSSTTKVQSAEPTGNKIMIVTNRQGQQSRVLLTPAYQKLIGYQTTGSKSVKNTLKGNILQKASNAKSTVSSVANLSSPKVPGIISHAIVNSKGEIISTSNQNLITSDGQVLMPVKPQQIRSVKNDTPKGTRKVQVHHQKVLLQEGLNTLKGSSIPGQQKTIVIKNQQGQIVKKFQGTDDAFLEQQVAEQVQAIKASGSFSAMKARQEVSTSKFRPPLKRSYPKKSTVVDAAQRTAAKPQMVLNTGFTTTQKKSDASIPPLAPISPKKPDTLLLSQSIPKVEELKIDSSSASKDVPKLEQVQQKPLNQLIIQDALGNQTTITEGQILALPSGETIDGQPQSYMLVTLDEAGNLAPLNNEALLSLDPNLCLGGDLSNMVLQIDEGAITAKRDTGDSAKTSDGSVNNSSLQESSLPQSNDHVQKEVQQPNMEIPIPLQEHSEDKAATSEKTSRDSTLLVNAEPGETPQQNVEAMQTVTCSIGSDPNQQLIITGDPISTQKFIESLTEGNPDLANLLASAEGNILIQTDEQQILINTDAENQVLLPMNADGLGVMENSEGDGNPIFANQPPKNQDILAAALADTDVFQQEQSASPAQSKIVQSQLSPNSGLYPTGVGNVLGTTLSLSSPIMTPLEVPSSNNKKIPDEESDILTTEVPKNVDLPITITDPNISQTVAQQQLIASELTGNLDLPLAIPDQGVPLTSAEMNSPSFVYSLPSLDESVDIHQKAFSGPISMPLLTEEPQESTASDNVIDSISSKSETKEKEPACSAPCDVDIQSTSSSSNLHSPSIDETRALFESSTSPDTDCIKDSEKLQSSSTTSFLGTTIETEEGLCTLGGAMCSSLSEPPPDMFDLSVVNRSYSSESSIKDHIETSVCETPIIPNEVEHSPCEAKPIDSNSEENSNTNEQNVNNEEYDKFETYDTESRNDGTPSSNVPLNSESSSPAVNIDENSCEIPVQPQIVTDLSSSSFETHETVDSGEFESNKRIPTDDSIENEKKKIKFD